MAAMIASIAVSSAPGVGDLDEAVRFDDGLGRSFAGRHALEHLLGDLRRDHPVLDQLGVFRQHRHGDVQHALGGHFRTRGVGEGSAPTG